VIAHRTEVGAAMMSKGNPMNGMNGMGDMFTYPPGTNPGEFLAQQASTAAMPTPGMPIPINIQGEQMEETYLYDRAVGQAPQVGQMPWESGPAPWEQTALPNHMKGPVYPGDAPREIARMHADEASRGDAKAVQAAQAAKIAADNAIRAAKAGAPQVAVTNAATAQAAASVAAQSARGAHGQRAAAIAANEATKATAAANVAANGMKKNGMGDWMELSGMGATGLLAQRVPVLGITYQTALMLGGVTALAVWGFPRLKKALK
jgi:hypothetical protein